MRLILALLALLWATSAQAKDLCVNQATGSDSNTYAAINTGGATDGTGATCWATLYRAVKGAAPPGSANGAQAAAAGDVVYVAAGTYSAAATNTRNNPAFNPENSGANDGSRITIRCATAGACALQLSSGTGPTLGCFSRNYITWWGFSVDEATAPSRTDTGAAVGWDSTGCRLERLTIDGGGTGHNQADNHTGLRYEVCHDCAGVGNRISNVYTCPGGTCTGGGSVNGHNGACIQTYGSTNLLLEHNELSHCGSGIFLKGGPNGGWPGTITGHRVRFNVAHDILFSAYVAHAGTPAASGTPTIVSQNIAYAVDGACWRYWFFGDAQDPQYTHFLSNNCYDAAVALEFVGSPSSFDHGFVVQNNVISGVTNIVSSTQAGAWHQDPDQSSHEHNVYHAVSGTNFVLNGGGTTVTLPNWKLAPYSQDAAAPAAITSDPLFVDPAAGDFHLQPGSPALAHGRAIHGIGGADGTTIPAGALITGSEVIGPGDDDEEATVPDAPTIGTATAGNAQCSVAFTPGDDGGSSITGYTATSSPGSFSNTGGSSPIVVPGLSNGEGYTFTVTATNAAGTSSPSSASNTCTPTAPAPGAPMLLRLRRQ